MFRHEAKFPLTSWIPAASLVDNLSDAGAFPEAVPSADHARAYHFTEMRHPLGHRAIFRLGYRDGVLEMAGNIIEPAGWDYHPRQEHPEWYDRDHIGMMLDPGHDHTLRRMVAVLRDGSIETSDHWYLQGEEVSDVISKPVSLPPIDPDVDVQECDTGWKIRIRFRIESLATPDWTSPCRYPDAPIGLQLRFGVAGPVLHEAPFWPEKHPFWKTGPFAYGDILAPNPKIEIRELDFGKPVWKTGDRVSRLDIHSSADSATNASETGSGADEFDIRLEIQETVDCEITPVTTTIQPGKSASLETAYPFTSKWAPDTAKTARVRIRITDEAGKEVWGADYPFGFDAGIIVREPFDMVFQPGESTERPNPNRDDFVDAFRAWLLKKLPVWTWQTTRDGAPSDFYLKAENPEQDIDLMRETVFDDIARLIHSLFDDWQDAMCAASMILHHPFMTVHSSIWARSAGNAHTNVVLRLGGCFCSDTARIVARLAEILGKLYDVPVRGYSLGLRGHLTGLIETPIGEILLDPMLGIYYHTLDNRRHATLDEIREDKRLQLRMWSLAYNHGHEFFYKIYNQRKEPWQEGLLTFPENVD